jgi:acyl-CoA synthetase (AMP-forming)/AMP-acid ligase II/acyl carrier protein
VQIDFEETFSAALYPNYGLTESTSVATCARPGDPDRISGSAGKPLGINDVEVFTSNGEQATAGVVGEIRIRGNNICSGYLNRPEATSREIVNGWLHTGDLGVFDDNGALRVVDRLDNLVLVGGENVYPTEIERLLPELEGLQEGIVLSLPDRIMGSELVLVFRSSFSSAPIKEWRQRLLQQLSSFKVPRRFIRASDLGLTDFPKAANGKVQRSKIQSRLNDFFGVVSDESQAGRQTTHDSETLQKVKLILLNILQIDEIGDLEDMDSLPSWDSINHLNLVMTLEQDFSISFNAKQITEMTSLPAIVAAVEKLKNQQ